MPQGLPRKQTCECGNEKPTGEKACAQCLELDQQRKILTEEMRTRHMREGR